MKKSLKLVILGSLLSPIVFSHLAFAAEVGTTPSKATATFIDESTVDPEVGSLRFDKNNPITEIQFGDIFISGDTTTYSAIYNKDVTFKADGETTELLAPLNVTTIDNRGSNGGWSMNVKLSEQFKTSTGEKLDGAKLVLTSTEALSAKPLDGRMAPTGFKTATLASDVDYQAIMGAKGKGADAGQGVGTWTTLFGDRIAEDKLIKEKHNVGQLNEYIEYAKNDKVQLIVPGGITKADNKEYQAMLTWQLTDTPEV